MLMMAQHGVLPDKSEVRAPPKINKAKILSAFQKSTELQIESMKRMAMVEKEAAQNEGFD